MNELWLKWGIYLLLALVWGSSFILIMRGLDAFTPMQIAAFRMIIAGLSLLPFVLGKAHKVKREEWKYIILMGLSGNAIPAFLFPLAETKINSATAGILNVLSPIWVLVLGTLFFSFTFSRRQFMGIFLGFVGVASLILLGNEELAFNENVAYSMLPVLAAMGYGLSTIIMKKYLNQTPSRLASGFGLLIVSIPYVIYLIGFSDIITVFETQPKAWASLGYVSILAVFGTGIATVLFYRLVQMTNPIFSSSVTYVIPLVALAWGLLDGEQIGPWQILSMFVILGGVYLVNERREKRPQS